MPLEPHIVGGVDEEHLTQVLGGRWPSSEPFFNGFQWFSMLFTCESTHFRSIFDPFRCRPSGAEARPEARIRAEPQREAGIPLGALEDVAEPLGNAWKRL